MGALCNIGSIRGNLMLEYDGCRKEKIKTNEILVDDNEKWWEIFEMLGSTQDNSWSKANVEKRE